MTQHLLIAAATSKYDNLPPHEERPQLARVLDSIVALFTEKIGQYTRQLEEIALNPTAESLRRSLDSWFASAQRDPADWVVLYYTGHAEVVGANSLYLLTKDYQPPLYPSTAFGLKSLADIVLAGRGEREPRRVRNLLVIMDTCFAGEGALDLTSQLAEVFQRNTNSSFYVLGAALPRQEAQAGALARALIDAVEDLSKRYVMQQWLYLEQIVPAINQRLRAHQVVWSVVDSPGEPPKFFPNPSFVDTGNAPVPANDARRAIDDAEFREHWGPRARGVEFDSQPGSYFSGRRAVLAKLAAFLAAQPGGTVVVTGRPGSGKSAVLGRLVTLAIPEYASKAAVDDEEPSIPPIHLVLHARGKSLEDVAARLGRALGTAPTTEAVLDHLARAEGATRIVVDALDEAAEASAIAERLLVPLGALPAVKLVMGTRKEYLPAFEGASVIDLDEPEYAPEGDIARFVERRLLRQAEPGQPTPYAGRESTAARVARAVEARVYPNFLLARIVVEDLLSRSRAADPSSAAEMDFPLKVAVAFDAYLARFGAREVAVRDLLLPLAYAEGQGLPWDNVWSAVATSLSRRPYADDDIRWLLANAGAFVLETVENDRSVYRLYHKALAETLGRGRRTRSVQARIARALVATAPRSLHGPLPDWFMASAYVRAHLASHAAKGGSLGTLMADPLFLLAAAPSDLLPAIASRRDSVPGEVVAVYEAAVDHIRVESAGAAASYLEMSARQNAQAALADRIAALPLNRPWRALWSRWTGGLPSRSFGKGASTIHVLVAAEWNRRSLALVGRADGSAEVWDASLGERLAYWKPEGVEFAPRVALADGEGAPLLIAGWRTGHLGVFPFSNASAAPRSGDSRRESPVTAVCCAERGGRRVCVTAHADRRLVMRELPSLEPILERPDATIGNIDGLRVVEVGGRMALLSIGDYLRRDEADDLKTFSDPSTIRLWSLDDLSLLWEDGRDRRGVPLSSEPASAFGQALIVISQDAWGPVQLWDLERRRLLLEGEEASKHGWVHTLRGAPVLLEHRLGSLTARPLAVAGTGAWRALDALGSVEVPGEQFTGVIRLHGRSVILGAARDHVRVWDLESLLARLFSEPGAAKDGGGLHVTSLACIPSRPDEVYVGSFGRVLALAADTGSTVWERSLTAPEEPRYAVELATTSDGRLVAGTRGILHRIRASDPSEQDVIVRTDESLGRIASSPWRGRTLVFATIGRMRSWRVRVWDVDTGEEAETRSAYSLSAGEEDKSMMGLALHAGDEAVRMAFASKYGKVMVADFARMDGPPPRPAYKEWHVPQNEGEYVPVLAAGAAGDEVLLAAGTDYGRLAVWDFQSGRLLAWLPSAHPAKISAMGIGAIGTSPVLATGGADGLVRLWTTRLREITSIVVGEWVTALAWSGPGRLAVGSAHGVLMLDLASLPIPAEPHAAAEPVAGG